jgi:hypothetical protein
MRMVEAKPPVMTNLVKARLAREREKVTWTPLDPTRSETLTTFIISNPISTCKSMDETPERFGAFCTISGTS